MNSSLSWLYFSYFFMLFRGCFSSVTIKSVRFPENLSHIFCDMDGTFLRSSLSVSSRSSDAVLQAMNHGICFFPATGRSRPSLARCLDEKFLSIFGGVNKMAGVYQQGLMVYDIDGNIIYEKSIDADVIEAVEDFCSKQLSKPALVGYSEDRVFCREQSIFMKDLVKYRDPVPEVFPEGLTAIRRSGTRIDKLILMHEPHVLSELRPLLESFLGTSASTTQAVPDMLEVLPFRASKGHGVAKLLEYYNISPADAIAFGDGENDIEMFKLAGFSAAVSNANMKLKAVASAVIPSNDDDGVAHALESLITQRMRFS